MCEVGKFMVFMIYKLTVYIRYFTANCWYLQVTDQSV